jgi:hypothetical protein
MNRRICSVFTIEFDRRQSLMLVRFAGTFRPDDLATLDELSDVFIAAEHPTRAPYDFTAVEYIDMPPEVMAMRAGQAQFCSHMRQAVVAPQAEIFGLVRLYGINRRRDSGRPMTTSSLSEAMAWLDVEDPDFTPIAASWVVAVERRDGTAQTH